ncbi:MAG: GntR family transcriptional regulator [Deltaproteobacteria bacterium]|nr:GntR family transcriptional regulator [Deltaproteobacteria bacterium]
MSNAIQIGQYHELAIIELVPAGVLLNADGVDLFLPAHLAPDNAKVGEVLEVFVYGDHDGAPQATTWEPAAVLGEFAYLKCVSVTRAGAYLDWGVPKDLYVPPAEQTSPMVEGRRYVVAICLDRKGEQLIGSAQLSKRFDYDVEKIDTDDEVDVLVYGRIDAGAQVVVAQRYRGLIHQAEYHRPPQIGAQLRGFVRRVRDDNRLDIGLTRRGMDGIDDAKSAILSALEKAGGTLPLNDGSSPDEIRRLLGLSKKAFKRGTGRLYKARKIVFDERGISLVDNDDA